VGAASPCSSACQARAGRETTGTTNLLLLVDQWEELYTYRPTEPDAAAAHADRTRRFIKMLLEAVRGGVLQVVLTLRADSWGEVLNDAALAARLPDEAIVHLRALDREALEAVIRRPAETIGLTVPDTLVEVLLNDASGQPGDLPLLGFALQHLWFERSANALTLQAYRAMGGLPKAIVTRAEALYARLNHRSGKRCRASSPPWCRWARTAATCAAARCSAS
jgi:hypothetical protein